MQGAHKPYDYSGDNWALNMEEECFNVQIKVHDEEAKQAVIDAAEAARKEAEKKAKKQGKAKVRPRSADLTAIQRCPSNLRWQMLTVHLAGQSPEVRQPPGR